MSVGTTNSTVSFSQGNGATLLKEEKSDMHDAENYAKKLPLAIRTLLHRLRTLKLATSVVGDPSSAND
jgi:hypothetical protein